MRRREKASTPGSLSRRDFLRLGGAGLAGAALLGAAGCDGGGGGSGELVFSFGSDATGNLQRLVDRFNDQNEGGFRVRYREMPADPSQYFDQLQTELQSGASEIDVMGTDVIWTAQLAANGWVTDLSERFTEGMRGKYLPAPLESLTYDGKVWGVPWYTDAGLLYYREDLLEESGFSGPPKTWNELKEQAQKTARDTNTRFGFVFQGAQYEGGVVNGLEYIWTHGGDVLDGDGVIIDSPESVEGLSTQRDMIEDGVAPQAVANYAETESHATFLNGDAVFIRQWPYMYALAANPEESRIEQDRVGIAALPVGGGQSFSGLGGWNMMVNVGSDMQDEAWEFVRFMTGVEGQKQRALEATLLPSLKSLYEDQEVLDQVPVIALGREALENARPRPVSPVYSDMSLEMAEQFNASLNGDVQPQEAISSLQTELAKILEQTS